MISGKIKNLIKAMKQRKKILFEDVTTGEMRIVKPFVMFSVMEDSKFKVLVNCYQEIGESKSGHTNGWKNIVISDKTKITILDETFEVKPDYVISESRFKNIISHV